MTSNTFSVIPATTPAPILEGIPFKPPVLGTTTLLTFLIIFPLTLTLAFTMSSSKTSRHLLAQ